MSTSFVFRFQEKQLCLPTLIHRDPPPEQTKKEPRRSGERRSVIEVMNQIQQNMKDPEYVEHNQARIWIEESCALGDLVFAGLDMPWQEFYQKAQSLLQQFSGYAISVNAELLEQTDWRNYQPPEPAEPAAAETKERRSFFSRFSKTPEEARPAEPQPEPKQPGRSIRQALEHPEQALYYQLARLYQEIQTALGDYPAMQTLLERYCTQAASDVYHQMLKRLGFHNLTSEELGLVMANGFGRILHQEIQLCYALEQSSECVERYLTCWPQPDATMVSYADMDDRELSAATYTSLTLLAGQLKQLASFQPSLASLVEYTLAAADADPEKPADYRYGDALITNHRAAVEGNRLYEKLHMRMLGRLSMPKEDPKARKHPDIASRSYLVADCLTSVVMAEFVQMCAQHQTVRPCQRCGKLFVPFSGTAKYCSRTAPNQGKCTCKKAASDEAAEQSQRENPALKLYTKIGNRLNTGLSRVEGLTAERRSKVMKCWRAEVKPLVQQFSAEGEDFDAAAFEQLLTDHFDDVWNRKKTEWAKKKRGKQTD